MTPFDFLALKMALACRFGFRETSCYRSPESNAVTAGAVPDSLHQYWLAADVVLDDPNETHNFAKACERLGVVAFIETGYIHIQAP